MPDPHITAAVITYAKKSLDPKFLSGSAKAELTLSNGSTRTFSWYHDEVTFTEDDFIGRTMAALGQVYFERDLAWLRS